MASVVPAFLQNAIQVAGQYHLCALSKARLIQAVREREQLELERHARQTATAAPERKRRKFRWWTQEQEPSG